MMRALYVPYNDKRPGGTTVKRLAEKLNKEMFMSDDCYYRMEDIVRLLNQLSGYEKAPNPTGILWGSCITSMISMQQVMKQLGVQGTDIQQQVKQGMAASVLLLDKKYNVQNKKLIDHILPHKDDHCRNDFIDKCVVRRKALDLFGDPEYFCNNGQKYVTPSYVYICVVSLYMISTMNNAFKQKHLKLLLKVIGIFG